MVIGLLLTWVLIFVIFKNLEFLKYTNIPDPCDLLYLMIDEPVNILYLDASICERFYHVMLPFFGYGVPQGLSSFSDLIIKAQASFPSYWWGKPSNKVMSGIGAAFWELGFFSLPLFILPFRLGIVALGRNNGLFGRYVFASGIYSLGNLWVASLFDDMWISCIYYTSSETQYNSQGWFFCYTK